MRKKIGVLILLCMLAFVACETKSGIDVNFQCWTKHTSEVVKVESSLLGEKDQVVVVLTWGWTLSKPTADAIIIERSIGDSANFTPIDTVFEIADVDSFMSCIDADTILAPNALVYYHLNSLYGSSIETFKTIDVNIPAAQHITQPATDTTNFANDTLSISFSRLAGLDTTDIAIYKGGPTSIDSLLNFLLDPLYDTTIVDTIIRIPNADSLFPADTLTPYTIRVSASSVSGLDLITDTSIGFRAFIRLSKKR